VRFALIAWLVACGATEPPPEQPKVFVSSPGHLSTSHAAIDNQLGCNDCHVSSTPKLDNDKCLRCHDAIADRMVLRAGMHGSAKFRSKRCWECHREHRGRSFDLRGWNTVPGGERGFGLEHGAKTEFPLRSTHTVTMCAGCHPKTNAQGLRLYLGTERACIGCHESRDRHRTRLACERCHVDAGWRPAKPTLDFEHSKAMPLLGAHAGVACMKCHTDGVFQIHAGTCRSCHADPHVYPEHDPVWSKCEGCHAATARTFAEITFDHAEGTKVSLGAHKKLRCIACHASRDKVTECAACHDGVQPAQRTVSQHAGRFGNRGCQQCHTPVAWRTGARFDHRATGFPLVGKHGTIGCRACHRGTSPAAFENLSKQATCIGCHAHQKVHDNKYANDDCMKCHY
jgi:hypothetical protein